MKYIIFGLGNIGTTYQNTRHNIGFKVLDALARASNLVFSPAKLGDRAEFKFKGRTIVLIKPSTFMNLSGKAVNYWMQTEKVKAENILVITDDLALPFGKLRLKGKGSDGGHNGLKDIIATLGSNTFPRLRFGISAEFSQGKQVNYVLGEWNKEEESKLEERCEVCIEIIKGLSTIGLQQTMSTYNNK